MPVSAEVNALAESFRKVQEEHGQYEETEWLEKLAHLILLQLSKEGYKIVPLGGKNA